MRAELVPGAPGSPRGTPVRDPPTMEPVLGDGPIAPGNDNCSDGSAQAHTNNATAVTAVACARRAKALTPILATNPCTRRSHSIKSITTGTRGGTLFQKCVRALEKSIDSLGRVEQAGERRWVNGATPRCLKKLSNPNRRLFHKRLTETGGV